MPAFEPVTPPSRSSLFKLLFDRRAARRDRRKMVWDSERGYPVLPGETRKEQRTREERRKP